MSSVVKIFVDQFDLIPLMVNHGCEPGLAKTKLTMNRNMDTNGTSGML